MPNPENLVPFMPGQSGNPNGRPKGKKESWEARVRRIINRQAPEALLKSLRDAGFDVKHGDVAELIVLGMIVQGMKGKNAQALREVAEMAYGKPRQRIQHTGDDEEPVVVKTVFVNAEGGECPK